MNDRFTGFARAADQTVSHSPAERRPARPQRLLQRWFGPAAVALVLISGTALAQSSPASKAQQLIEAERIRGAVEDAFKHYYQFVDDGNIKNDNLVTAAGMLAEIGPPAVPLLANELQQALRYNYTFVAYSLGRIGGPEAEAALREAVASAGELSNDFATMRRAWACYALAMQGHLDALDLFNKFDPEGPEEGNQLAAGHWIHMDMSVLEAAALMLGDRSVPILHAQLDRYTKTDGLKAERQHVLKALRRLSHKDSLPKIIAHLGDNDQVIRREAADALHTYTQPEAVDALMERLKVETLPHVRFIAAWSLREIGPSGRTAEFLKVLENEYDINVRGVLYHLIAAQTDKATFTALKDHLGQPDPRDRRELVAAVRRFNDPGATNVLRAALLDNDAHVMANGALGLAEVGDAKAVQALLDQIDSRRWLRTHWSLERLIERNEQRAIPLIIARLQRQLSEVIIDPLLREQIFGLGNALVALRHVGSIDPLLEGIARQSDGTLKLYLQSLMAKMDALRSNGDDVEAWTDAATSDDKEIRLLAYEVLGEIGTEPAAAVLASVFGRVEALEGIEILEALGNIDSASTHALFERILTSEAFDPYQRLDLREMAAYGARRVGGPSMTAALRASIERRDGRDGQVLLSYMLLEKENSLELYEQYAVQRLRYLKWSRGLEDETLKRLAGDIRAGHSLEFYDVPPAAMDFRRPR